MIDEKNGESRTRGRLWPLFIGLPIIAIIAVTAVIFAGGGNDETRNAGQDQQAAGGEERASGGGDESGDGRLGHPSLGDADAPVVMVEYSDYQ